MKFTILIPILILSVSVFGQRNPAQTDVDAMCNVTANIKDDDPKGVNVRSKPSGKSKKVGTIPYDSDGTTVDIIGYKGNWAKVESASTYKGVVFSKTGWVYSPLLYVTGTPLVEGGVYTKTYKSPSLNEFLINVRAYSVQEFAGCHQDWIKIKISQPKGKPKSGWIHSDFISGSPWNLITSNK